VLDAMRKVEGLIIDGILQLMQCLDVQMKIAQTKYPVSLGGLGVHFTSDVDGAACDAAFVVCSGAHACCGERGSQMFDPFQGSCGAALEEMGTDVFA
jgi:hypothetical protein